MRAFTTFLVEESTEDKLKHLEHPEDHIIKSGEPGFHHAFNTLKTTAEHLQGHDSGTNIMTKYDGAPSVVFGHDPSTGKFFVASKSAFNKNPKINYTDKDIEANHGHAPGLVSKLKAALKHLPKVAPKVGVFQGDFMYNKADGDVQEDEKNFHFKPQLIGYTAKKSSEQGQKIARAKMGFYVHTAYKGTDLANMKADYTPDIRGFKDHPDVHMHYWNQGFDAKKAKYTPEEHAKFKSEMNAAGEVFKNGDRGSMFKLPVAEDHVTTYINKMVVHGDKPSVKGLEQHVASRWDKEIDKVKTDKSKQAKAQAKQADLAAIHAHRKPLEALLQIHGHLAAAKNALLPALERGDKTGYSYDIHGQPTSAEGTVVVTKENRPTKLVNRGAGGFAQMNLSKGGFGTVKESLYIEEELTPVQKAEQAIQAGDHKTALEHLRQHIPGASRKTDAYVANLIYKLRK